MPWFLAFIRTVPAFVSADGNGVIVNSWSRTVMFFGFFAAPASAAYMTTSNASAITTTPTVLFTTITFPLACANHVAIVSDTPHATSNCRGMLTSPA